MKALVVGAGSFGGWIAFSLQQRGASVTLVDARGPGNSQASSGGETRIIRTMYGADVHSTKMAARAIELWKQYEQRWRMRLLYPSEMLLMAGPADEFVSSSKRVMQEHGVAVEELSIADARRRFPHISFEGIDSTLLEPGAGVLPARETCRAVVERFIASGGDYRVSKLDREVTQSKDPDVFVFACGPWLPKLFPELLGHVVRPTRQNVLFFATPAGNDSFKFGSHPVWADRTSEEKYYGVPDFQHRGFKIAADLRGPGIDPDAEDRIVNADALVKDRAYLGRRFPALRHALLSESRVCQYENTPDLNFIIDRDPKQANVWIAGGGSGHGYKHGPALGEYVAKLILDGAEPDPVYRLDRFAHPRGPAPLSSF